jgi:hypothetical protein
MRGELDQLKDALDPDLDYVETEEAAADKTRGCVTTSTLRTT